MISQERAQQIAKEWIDAWNSHDLEAILAHYSEGVEFISPFVASLLGEPGGKLRGKDALRGYFAGALVRFPELRFRLHQVFTGMKSITLYYQSVKGLLAAEVMEFDAEGRIARVLAHYAPGE